MIEGMKCGWLLLLLLPLDLRAEWSDLRDGIDARAVLRAVGQPLIRSRARAGLFETWTYDRGGYAMFVRGRLLYWHAPKSSAK